MSYLTNKIAVVTGASSGIGKAVALSLLKEDATVCLVGRNIKSLEAVASSAKEAPSQTKSYKTDLTLDEDIQNLSSQLQRDFGNIDMLIHSAGSFAMGELEHTSVDVFDKLYRTNVRAPYLLTQVLLPMIRSSRGEIVFINSSVGFKARAKLGQYAATKHALKAIAESLRDEVNSDGVRVLSLFLGRTATPMQAKMHEIEYRDYSPKKLMQPEDVAAILINALTLPRTAEVTDIHIRPFNKLD
jgi:short-subunit dehydrogenase